MSVWRALMLAADEVTGGWWGEGGGWMKSAGLCYFPMKETARQGGRNRPYAWQQLVLWRQRLGLLFIRCYGVTWKGEHMLSGLSQDLSQQRLGWSFLSCPALQDICTSIWWGFPGMLKKPPIMGLSSCSSAPVPSAVSFWKISRCKIN